MSVDIQGDSAVKARSGTGRAYPSPSPELNVLNSSQGFPAAQKIVSGRCRMKATYRRLRIILLLMLGTTLLAGYVGVIFLPSMMAVWLGSVLIFASPVALVMPALVGAQIAWPVTCVALPLAALAIRPARAWTAILLAPIGTGAGLIAGQLGHRTSGYGTGADLLWACALSGAVLGALFGHAMWRFDRSCPVEGEAPGDLRITVRENWLNIALPVAFLAVATIYMTFREPSDEPLLDGNGMKICSERGGKLAPQRNGHGFACVNRVSQEGRDARTCIVPTLCWP